MTNTLPYALTSVNIAPWHYDQLLVEGRLNSEEGLAVLGLNQQTLDHILIVMDKDKDTLFVSTDDRKDKRRFHCIGSSPLLRSDYQANLDKCLENYRTSKNPVFRKDLVALVHKNSEQVFLAAAINAGYSPKKKSDEFFPILD